jgi:adenylate kinase
VRLAEALDAHFFSVGALLRAAVSTQTPLGQQIEPILNAGEVVPTALLLPILEEATAGVPNERPIILDFAGTGEQCAALDEMLARHGRAICATLVIEAPHAELLARLLSRGRTDDTPSLIEERFAVYEREIVPVYTYYQEQGSLHVVDGSGDPEVVTERLLAQIQSLGPHDALL